MDALASPVLACSAIGLFHPPGLYTGMACGISFALDRTSLSPSHYRQSTPAPAGQVVTLRWKCGSDRHSRVNGAPVSLPFPRASCLVLLVGQSTCLSRHLVHPPALHWPGHS